MAARTTIFLGRREQSHTSCGSGYSDGATARVQGTRADSGGLHPRCEERGVSVAITVQIEQPADLPADLRRRVAHVLTAVQDSVAMDPRTAFAGLRRVAEVAEEHIGHAGAVLPYTVGIDQLLSVVPGLAESQENWEALADYAATMLSTTWGERRT